MFLSCSSYVLNNITDCRNIKFSFQEENFDLVMVRFYKRKSQKGQHDGTLMLKAVHAVSNGLSIRTVARKLRLNRTTIGRYVKRMEGQDLKTLTGADFKSKMNHRQIFTPEEDTLLRKYLMLVYNLFNGLTCIQTRILVYDMAINWSKNLLANWANDRMGGVDFVRSFVRKHHDFITFKPPESTTLDRAHSFSKRTIDDLIIWIKTMFTNSFWPSFIFSIDAAGIKTVRAFSKVIGTNRSKQVFEMVREERGTLAAVCCLSVPEKSVPPAMVFRRGSIKEYLVNGVPLRDSGFTTPSEWNNGEIFPNMLKHLIKNVACSKEVPQMVVMDNDERQINFDVVDRASKNNITMITFQLHCSPKLLPLNIAVNDPLKYYYKKAVGEWNLSNKNKIFTIFDIPSCFVEAYQNTCNYQNIINGFKKSEISPSNSNVFCKDEFLLSTVFEPISATDTN